MKGRPLHLFDTFEGLPKGTDILKKGQFAVNVEDVKNYLLCGGGHRCVFL